MTVSHRERVGRGLDAVRDGIKPQCVAAWKAAYGAAWIEEIQRRDRASVSKPDADDLVFLLRGIQNTWQEVWRKRLGQAERAYTSELREARNRWAHQQQFSADDTYRMLDTAERLLRAFGASEQVRIIQGLKRESQPDYEVGMDRANSHTGRGPLPAVAMAERESLRAQRVSRAAIPLLPHAHATDGLKGGMVAGVDGCRGGWIVVTASADQGGASGIERVTDLRGVLSRLDAGQLLAVAIDVPIGLPDTQPRRCDLEARRLIGARRSSVFPAPLRGLLGAKTFEEASERSKAISGKGLSLQAFALLPKIEQVDRIMSPERQRHLVEMHPEVCFTALAGAPMSHHKSTAEGQAERLAALRPVFPDIDEEIRSYIPGSSRADIIDAFVGAWTARRWMTGSHIQLGGDLDRLGLRMEMIA